jgi:hypothetical protein
VNLKQSKAAALLPLMLAASCSPSPSEQRGIKEGDIQLVAQWLENGSESPWGRLTWTFTTQDRVSAACGSICFVDGNDLGSGTRNLYLYTQPKDVRKTINLLIELEGAKRLPGNMRIGIAEYKNEKHSDWTYRPAYPAGLKQFSIVYSGSSRRR